MNLDILRTRLAVHGYEIVTASNGEEALAKARAELPDLILLDVMMPKMDGFEVCRSVKTDRAMPFIPIILVTAKADSRDVIAGLEAGADEYLAKPVDQAALVARVKSVLRIKELHDTVQDQNARLEAQTAELADWNRTLERRVEDQLTELDRVGRLRRFFSPQVADLIVSAGSEKLLESHRREITAVFCDLSNFTAFSESVEPEDVMSVLREFHAAAGQLIVDFEGTLEHFVRDGIIVLFNDPLPCPDAALQAVRMALAMRQRINQLAVTWRKHGHELGLRAGIASGYATLGTIGSDERFDYGAVGTVMDLSFRLCDAATAGQILISPRVHAAVEEPIEAAPVGHLSLKGFLKPVRAFNVLREQDKERAAAGHDKDGFEECAQCGRCYDIGTTRCELDAAPLTPAQFPRLLAGRYRAERRLGRGGMGTVYEATDRALERRVAVKLIRDDLEASGRFAERFRHEALAAAHFAHPNVVTVHDFVVAEGHAFLVMELLDGSSLREELRRRQRLPSDECVEVLRDVCAAIDAAHRSRLVHRDLKPENIFLVHTGDNRIAKVLDFGLAKGLPSQTAMTTHAESGRLEGTLLYMPPEQLHGGPVDMAWDVWALAVVTYEMLAGAHPFARATVAECCAAVLLGNFARLAVALPEAPPHWDEFFVRAFTLDPAKRLQSVQEFQAELERTLRPLRSGRALD
jgi:adenylate cyclase